MGTILRLRLLLDLIAVSLIIACLAYWWLDNLSHELFGTALFVLIVVHNVFNRRWYGGVSRRKLDAVRVGEHCHHRRARLGNVDHAGDQFFDIPRPVPIPGARWGLRGSRNPHVRRVLGRADHRGPSGHTVGRCDEYLQGNSGSAAEACRARSSSGVQSPSLYSGAWEVFPKWPSVRSLC